MNILFLDIDGVLTSFRTSTAYGAGSGGPMRLPAFDHVAVGLLRGLCDAADVRIVLSSSLRLVHSWTVIGQALRLPVVGATPNLFASRGSEIEAWLEEHPQVRQYAIVDDQCEMLDHQRSRFVQVNGEDGLLWRDYARLCTIFGVGPYAGRPQGLSMPAALFGRPSTSPV